jgi:DNA replication protein DnaC
MGEKCTALGVKFKIDTYPTLADAILDRLVHNAYKINLKGESMRKKQKLQSNG